MVAMGFTTDENPENTLGTGTSDLENGPGVNTNLYSGQVEEALDCMTILLILATLPPTLVVLAVTINSVFTINYILNVMLRTVVLMMKLILIVIIFG